MNKPRTWISNDTINPIFVRGKMVPPGSSVLLDGDDTYLAEQRAPEAAPAADGSTTATEGPRTHLVARGDSSTSAPTTTEAPGAKDGDSADVYLANGDHYVWRMQASAWALVAQQRMAATPDVAFTQTWASMGPTLAAEAKFTATAPGGTTAMLYEVPPALAGATRGTTWDATEAARYIEVGPAPTATGTAADLLPASPNHNTPRLWTAQTLLQHLLAPADTTAIASGTARRTADAAHIKALRDELTALTNSTGQRFDDLWMSYATQAWVNDQVEEIQAGLADYETRRPTFALKTDVAASVKALADADTALDGRVDALEAATDPEVVTLSVNGGFVRANGAETITLLAGTSSLVWLEIPAEQRVSATRNAPAGVSVAVLDDRAALVSVTIAADVTGAVNFDVSLLTVPANAPTAGGARPWAAGDAVQASELRVQTVAGCLCLMRSTADAQRTTGAAFDAAEAANWALVSQVGEAAYAASTLFLQGMRVRSGGRLLERSATGLSAATYAAGEWAALAGVGTAIGWFAGNPVFNGEKRTATIGGVTMGLRSNATRTTGAALDAAELGNWTYDGQAMVGVFTANAMYPAGARILQDGSEWQRKANGSEATFTAANWDRLGNNSPAVNTYTGLQVVGTFTPAAPTVYDTLATITAGIDFTKCDFIEWTFRLTTDLRAITSFVPVVVGGSTPTMEASHGSGQISSFLASAADAAAGKLTNVDCHGVAFEVIRIRGWANAANGFVVPTGREARTACTVTVNGGATWTLFGGTSARIMAAPPAGQMVTAVAASAGLTVGRADDVTGALEVAVVEGTTSGTITVTYADMPTGFVRLAPASGSPYVVNANAAEVSTTFTVPSSGQWDASIAISGWDDVQTNSVAYKVEILNGATVVDTVQAGGLQGNHINNNWMYVANAEMRCTLTSGITYTLKVTSNGASATNGTAIQSATFRLASAVTYTAPQRDTSPDFTHAGGNTNFGITIPYRGNATLDSLTLTLYDRRGGALAVRTMTVSLPLSYLIPSSNNGWTFEMNGSNFRIWRDFTMPDNAVYKLSVTWHQGPRVLWLFFDDQHSNTWNTYGAVSDIRGVFV